MCWRFFITGYENKNTIFRMFRASDNMSLQHLSPEYPLPGCRAACSALCTSQCTVHQQCTVHHQCTVHQPAAACSASGHCLLNRNCTGIAITIMNGLWYLKRRRHTCCRPCSCLKLAQRELNPLSFMLQLPD